MGVLRTLLAFAGLVLCGSTAAHAGPLVSASFALDLGWFSTVTFPGVDATGTATSATSAALGAGGFAGTETTFVTPTTPFPADVLQAFITGNGAGIFAGTTPGAVGGTATIFGKAVLFPTKSFFPGSPFITIPLKIGKETSFALNPAGIAMSVFGAPWTVGTTVITGVVTGVPGTATNLTVMGINALTPGGAGTLTLVSPGKIYTCVGNKLPVIGTLTLTFVPEPGTFLLLATGVALLRALGRRAH